MQRADCDELRADPDELRAPQTGGMCARRRV
jgi:hypothetical protein